MRTFAIVVCGFMSISAQLGAFVAFCILERDKHSMTVAEQRKALLPAVACLLIAGVMGVGVMLSGMLPG